MFLFNFSMKTFCPGVYLNNLSTINICVLQEIHLCKQRVLSPFHSICVCMEQSIFSKLSLGSALAQW